MACVQGVISNSLIVRQAGQAQTARRQSRRPFTTLASIQHKQATTKLNAGALSQLFSAGAAAALLLVRR